MIVKLKKNIIQGVVMKDWCFSNKAIKCWDDAVNYVFHSDKHYCHSQCTLIKINDECIQINRKSKSFYKTPEEAIDYLNDNLKF